MMKHSAIKAVCIFGMVLLMLLGGSSIFYGQDAGDDIFSQIMQWTQKELKEAGETKKTSTGESHSNVFVGDNKRYDNERGEVKRKSFVEGELFRASNIALTGEMTKEVVEEIKLHTKPEDWYAQIKSAKHSIGKQSLDHWYKELSECGTVCAQIVVRMMAKHFEAVSNLPHFFVMFRTGSDSIDYSYNGFLEQIGNYLGTDSNLNVLIIGRASKTGDRAYNRELSRKRADSIKYKLLERNVAPERISIVYLGYEPPQISHNVIELYQLNNPMVNLNHPIDGLSLYQINQSAIVALINK